MLYLIVPVQLLKLLEENNRGIYSYENNNFEVLIDYNISNSHFVFKKELESFEAHMLITVQVL